ncbi:MAG: FAD binding domain-containing protein [Candidatus Limnocylindria bacterium]
MFRYERPTGLAETLALMKDTTDARLLCGGTDLLVGLRKGTITTPLVIDIKGVAELEAGVEEVDGALRIGATTPLTRISADPRIRATFPALVEGMNVVGSIQIRNRATLAGNVCNASPAADTAPPLLVYDAVIELAGTSGRRRVPLVDFFVGPGTTVMEPGELVSALELPLPGRPLGSSFERMTRRRGVDLATVNVACSVSSTGVTTFGYGAVGPRPFRVVDASGALADPALDPSTRESALRRLAASATPISNVRASAEYRREMLFVLSRRALDAALQRLAEATHAG